MLSRANRMPRALFAEILKSRRFNNSPHFTLRVQNSKEPGARAAVSVSKKISKSAVLRNTIRRRAYAVIKNKIPDLKPGLYLFVAKAGAQKTKGAELQREISSLLNLETKS